MINITKPIPESIIFRDKKYMLNLSYDNVLNVFELFKDDVLFDYEKIDMALTMLVKGCGDVPRELFETLFDKFISIGKSTGKSKLRTFDFVQDGVYLFSSFMADYGIDLFKEQGHLHWWKFISLFQGLSDKTKMHEVMSIRSRPLPEPNKHNGAEISSLIELKNYYALEISQSEREQNFKKGIAGLAETLKAKAR